MQSYNIYSKSLICGVTCSLAGCCISVGMFWCNSLKLFHRSLCSLPPPAPPLFSIFPTISEKHSPLFLSFVPPLSAICCKQTTTAAPSAPPAALKLTEFRPILSLLEQFSIASSEQVGAVLTSDMTSMSQPACVLQLFLHSQPICCHC